MIDVVLGIETSCDETSAAVLVREHSGPRLKSLTILSQDVHRVFGGVVPELASRAHLRAIEPVVDTALAEGGVTFGEIDAIAVTTGPGLIGSLLVGVSYAKGVAAADNKALVGVHHIEGHIFAPLLEYPDLEPPFVALIVSGGHTLLLDVPHWGHYKLLGRTRDDAAGEAFDKVAAMLGLGYPGGPEIETLAREAPGPDTFNFPRPMLDDGFDFSFSGLKTAVLLSIRATEDIGAAAPAIARSFQDAVFDVLLVKTLRALEHTGYARVVVGGGVASSRSLAQFFAASIGNTARVYFASPRLNADNAAMIARAGWFHLERNERDDLTLDAAAAPPLPGLV